MARDILAVASSGVDLERLFCIARDVCHYRRSRLLPKTIRAIMLYMIGKNMEIRKGLELLEGADDHDNSGDEEEEEKEEDDYYDLIDYISDDEFDAASASATGSSHAIPGQSSSHPVVDRSDLSHDTPGQPRNACPASPQPPPNPSVISHPGQNKRKRRHQDEAEELNSVATQRPVRKRQVPERPDFVTH
jgi:hypothetical protein